MYIKTAVISAHFTLGAVAIAGALFAGNVAAQGHNVNVKAGYGRINPKTGRSTNLFTVQFQVFYF